MRKWSNILFDCEQFDWKWTISSRVVPEKLLLWMRILFAVYMSSVFIYVASWLWKDAASLFAWWNTYTHLSFFALLVYFCAAIGLTIFKRSTFRRNPPHNPVAIALYWLLYHSVVVSSLGVTLVYWVLLFPSRDPDRYIDWFSNISEHGVQLAFVCFEVSFNEMQMSFKFLPWFVLVVLLYIAESYIRFAVLGNWPYFFLDYRKPRNGIYYAALLVLWCLLFAMVLYAHRLRRRLIKRYGADPTKCHRDSDATIA